MCSHINHFPEKVFVYLFVCFQDRKTNKQTKLNSVKFYISVFLFVCFWCCIERTLLKYETHNLLTLKFCDVIIFILDNNLILFSCPRLYQQQNHHFFFFSVMKCGEYVKLFTCYFAKYKVGSST